MKRIFFLWISLLGVTQGFSQNYIPFNFEKGVWNCSSYIKEDGSYIDQYYCLGDTMVNDTRFFKLYDHRFRYPALGPFVITNTYMGLIRNNGKNQVILNDQLLYDFNLKVNDTVKFGAYSDYNLVISGIDSVQYCNTYHRRYIIDTCWLGIRAFTEGIGFSLGLINPIIDPFESTSKLDCYGEMDNLFCNECNTILNIKSYSKDFLIYPNPADEKIIISSEDHSSKIIHVCITNLLGQPLITIEFPDYPVEINTSALSSGIYCVLIAREGALNIEKFLVLRK